MTRRQTKYRANVTVDWDVWQQARTCIPNVSGFVERALMQHVVSQSSPINQMRRELQDIEDQAQSLLQRKSVLLASIKQKEIDEAARVENDEQLAEKKSKEALLCKQCKVEAATHNEYCKNCRWIVAREKVLQQKKASQTQP